MQSAQSLYNVKTAPQSVPKLSVRKLFPISSELHGVPATEPVTQLELELFLSLRNRLDQLKEQVASEEGILRARLEAGASIQPGVHVAELKEHFRRSVSWRDVTIRLANRLKLNGEAYCAKVLAATKPAKTVSLEVHREFGVSR